MQRRVIYATPPSGYGGDNPFDADEMSDKEFRETDEHFREMWKDETDRGVVKKMYQKDDAYNEGYDDGKEDVESK